MRSARRVSACFLATLPAVVLTGCVSTQRIAARARLVSARELASQSMSGVFQANPDVTVDRLTLIQTRTGTAVIASLRNTSSSTLTDLPISVGVHTRAHHTVYLNRTANLDYFESHVAAIGPRGATTWVLTTRRHLPGGRLFATVGVSQLHSSAGPRLPRIAAVLRARRSAPGGPTIVVSVANRSGIPQYDLQIYAVAIRGDRAVGAGHAALTHLGTNATTTVSITLLGETQRAALRLMATPTIFS